MGRRLFSRPRTLLFLAAAVFLASCAAPPPKAGEAPEGRRIEILMVEGHLFEPRTATVHPGDTIVFRNVDKDLHALTLLGHEDLLDNVFLDPGQRYTFQIPADMPPGSLDLRCTIHIDMTGTIVVEKP